MRRKVTHWLGPNSGGKHYLLTGRLYCGALDRLFGRTLWPAHSLMFTDCKRCLAKAKREGL